MRMGHLAATLLVAVGCAACGGSTHAAPAVTTTATITTTTTVSTAVTSTVTASPTPGGVLACESAHSLTSATQHTTSDGEIRFASCSSPPAVGAGTDGYLLITVTIATTTLDEASNESEYDLIQGPCRSFRVGYFFSDMGTQAVIAPVTLPQQAVDVIGSHGPTPVNRSAPGAPQVASPGVGQVVYLHNASYTADSAACAS